MSTPLYFTIIALKYNIVKVLVNNIVGFILYFLSKYDILNISTKCSVYSLAFIVPSTRCSFFKGGTIMKFNNGIWNNEINVRDFIVRNYTPYDGNASFLAPPTEKTKKLWNKVLELLKEERNRGGVYDIDEKTISTITSHSCGYIDKNLEDIVGLQTDEPLKRAIMPFGGIRMVHTSLKAYGKELPPEIDNIFKYRKTHNDGVFDVYTDDMRKARRSGIITGLPDAYGRGRIIGDYRRVPLYGVDRLIEDKIRAKNLMILSQCMELVKHIEEISEQIKALKELKEMAASYGFDISRPAENTKRHSNGYTLHTSLLSKSKTVLQCQSAEFLHSLISMLNKTSETEYLLKRKYSNLLTILL